MRLHMILLAVFLGSFHACSGVNPLAECEAGGGSCRVKHTSDALAEETADNDKSVSMLQLKGREYAQKPKKIVDNNNLCLEGGGAASVVLFGGFFAGLMAVVSRDKGIDNPTFLNTKLFDGVDNITSVSGGSWLAAGLAYSDFFARTIELMAEDPAGSAQVWNDRWTFPLLNVDTPVLVRDLAVIVEQCFLYVVLPPGRITNAMAGIIEVFLSIFTGVAGQRFLEDLTFFSYFFTVDQKTGNSKAAFTWESFVREFMQRTTKLDLTALMGDPPNPFMVGKTWIPVCSQVNAAPSTESYVYLRALWWSPIITSVRYNIKQDPRDKQCPVFTFGLCRTLGLISPLFSQFFFGPYFITPARFSFILGDGRDASAPLTFCADASRCGNRRIQYKGSSLSLWPGLRKGNWLTHDTPAPQNEEEWLTQAFDTPAGKLPVLDVTAASSALGGAVELFPALGANPACAMSNAGIFASNAPDGQSFRVAEDFITEQGENLLNKDRFSKDDFKRMVDMVYNPLADGGLSDNTGIMTAIGEGATRVFSMFSADISFIEMFNATFGTLNFNNFGAFAPFQETTQFAQDQLAAGTTLQVPAGFEAKSLQGITYGTMTVTVGDDVAADWFNMPRFAQIQIDWVYISSNIGLLEPLFFGTGDISQAITDSYNTLIDEIITVMMEPANFNDVKNILGLLGTPGYGLSRKGRKN